MRSRQKPRFLPAANVVISAEIACGNFSQMNYTSDLALPWRNIWRTLPQMSGLTGGEVKSVNALDRRQFIQSATGVLTGVLAAGSPFTMFAPSRAWALDLTALTTEQGAALMAATRTIAPHDNLEDAAYALVVRSLDTAAAKDETLRRQLQEGVAQLGANFTSAAESARVEALKQLESGAFFQTLRTNTLLVLYATPMAYAHFGYEGEAFSKGGYLFRGFNDLRWLPEVPAADSGPTPGSA
jgi:hypothetical protein